MTFNQTIKLPSIFTDFLMEARLFCGRDDGNFAMGLRFIELKQKSALKFNKYQACSSQASSLFLLMGVIGFTTVVLLLGLTPSWILSFLHWN